MKTFKEFLVEKDDEVKPYPMPPHVQAYYDSEPQWVKDYHADLAAKARANAARRNMPKGERDYHSRKRREALAKGLTPRSPETQTIKHFEPGNHFEDPHKSMHHDVLQKMGLKHEFTTVKTRPGGEMGADTASHFSGPGHLRDRVEKHLRHGYTEAGPGHFVDPHSSHSVRVTGGGSRPVKVVHRVKDNGGDNPQVDEKMRVKDE